MIVLQLLVGIFSTYTTDSPMEQTDEQAPLPEALCALLQRIRSGLKSNCDFVFNCQMGRGRTTTGMVMASLVATIDAQTEHDVPDRDLVNRIQISVMDGYSEEDAYLRGRHIHGRCDFLFVLTGVVFSRRIQTYLAACQCSIGRQGSKACHGSCGRRNAGRTKSSQYDLRLQTQSRNCGQGIQTPTQLNECCDELLVRQTLVRYKIPHQFQIPIWYTNRIR